MHEIWVALAPHLVELVGVLVAAGTTWLVAAIKRWIDAHTQSATTRAVLNAVINMAATVTQSLEQTVIKNAKVALADGKMSPKEYDTLLAMVKTNAVETIKTTIGAQFKGFDTSTIASLADHAVEAAVLQRSDVQKALNSSRPTNP